MPNTKENLKAGMRVKVKIDGELVEAKYTGWNTRYNMPNVEVNGKTIPRKIYEVMNGAVTSETLMTEIADASEVHLPETTENSFQRREFSINRRFEFLNKLVKMVATSTPTSLVICGPGGLGKSYTVFDCLRRVGMEECTNGVDGDFFVIKGFSTPKSLYRLMYENRDKVLVFDDCDSILKNETAVNILKAGLDSNPVRTVSWMTERGGGESEDSLPTRFDFVGKIIFISNLSLEKVPQAIQSRAQYVDVSMSQAQKLERMRGIINDLKPDMPLPEKVEVLNFLEEFKDGIRDLNIRTFLKVCDLRAAEPGDWRDIAEYVVTS